jgi:hypothetical protein
MKGSRRTSVLVLLASAMAAGTWAHAGTASLNGQPLTVTLLEGVYLPAIDIITAGPGGPQIVGNAPPSDQVGYLLFSNESVNVHDLQVVYNIEGGGAAYTGTAPQCGGLPGCSLWSTTGPDDARFVFSDLNFGSTGVILKSVSLTTHNVFGVTADVIGVNSFEMIFGSAGVLNAPGSGLALGTITVDLQTQVVPLPSSVVMLLGGLLLIVIVNGRGRHFLNSARS